MVYQGPSKACQRCKQRHIKCDETRPSCRNCIKRQMPCPGYAPEPGIRFQDETNSTIVQAQQRKRQPARKASTKQAAPVPISLPEDAEAAALGFFFDNYATLGRGSQSSQGLFEIIVPVYSAAAPASAMAAATSAVALTLTSEWHGKTSEAPLARRHLGKALSLLRASLNDPALSLNDDTMMAVLLLKFHDMLIAWKNLKEVPEDHVNGAIALIKHRGLASFNTEISKRLLQYVRHTAITLAIQRRTKLDRDSEIWRDPESMLKTPCIDLDWIALDVANLRASAEVRRLLHYHPATFTFDEKQKREVRYVRDQAAKLEMRLSVWADGLNGRWRPVDVSDPRGADQSICNAGLYGRNCQLYPSAQIANQWNLYRSYCLLVLGLLLRCEVFLEPYQSKHHPSTYATTFQSIVDDLCASVPFLLGNRTAPGCVDEFGSNTTIKFLKHPDDNRTNTESLEMDLFMDIDQRTKSLIAQGPWKLYDYFSQVVQFVNSDVGESLGSLVRAGQMEWIQEQMKRVMVIQRIEGKSSELKGKRSNTSIRGTGDGGTKISANLDPRVDIGGDAGAGPSLSSGYDIKQKEETDEGDFIEKFFQTKMI